eukprot:gene17624-22276_t
MHLEGVTEVLVSIIARLDTLPNKRFLAFMDAHNWLHAYDAKGKRREFDELPHSVTDLADDPYRSLAGEVRRAGGYAKSSTPYTAFLWADFFRDRIKPDLLTDHFARCVEDAVPMARNREARHLPGCGHAGVPGAGSQTMRYNRYSSRSLAQAFSPSPARLCGH